MVTNQMRYRRSFTNEELQPLFAAHGQSSPICSRPVGLHGTSTAHTDISFNQTSCGPSGCTTLPTHPMARGSQLRKLLTANTSTLPTASRDILLPFTTPSHTNPVLKKCRHSAGLGLRRCTPFTSSVPLPGQVNTQTANELTVSEPACHGNFATLRLKIG